MAGALRGIAEIVLMVGDMEKSLGFYRDVLGMEVISPEQIKGPKFLRVGAPTASVPPQVVLVPRPADAPAQPADRRLRSVHHIGFEISASALESEKARLEGRGYEVRTGKHPFLSVLAIYVDDPDGNEVELVAWTGGTA